MDHRIPSLAQPPAPAESAASPVPSIPAFLPPGMFPIEGEEVHASVTRDGISCILESRADSAVVRFVYTPIDGTLADLEVEINSADPVKLADEGGVTVEMNGRAWSASDEEVERRLVSCEIVGDSVEARWSWRCGEEVADFLYRLSLSGKTLVVELSGGQGRATGIDLGRVTGCLHPRLIAVPYLTLGEGGPSILCTGASRDPHVFVSSLLDWSGSRASALTVPTGSEARQLLRLNGGCSYLTKSDGRRNHLHERWLLTVSRQFEEVLPALPEADPLPPTPELAASVWYNVPSLTPGEESYIEIYERLRGFKQWGLDKLLVNHPADTWHDGDGNATLTLAGAPAKGGDDALSEYLEAVAELGYAAGVYLSFREIASANPHWSVSMAALGPDGKPAVTKPGRYLLKAERAAALAPAHLSAVTGRYRSGAVYLAGHASLAPWAHNDYDASVEGAGSFQTSYRWQQEILRSRAAGSAGPVLAEGGNHWIYAGLVHGVFARQIGEKPAWGPFLVDFDLRHLHLRQVSAGVGSPEEFFGEEIPPGDKHSRSPYLDRYLTATLAYGHAAVLPDPAEWDLAAVVKTYYLLAPLQPLVIGVPVTSIRYHRDGKLAETNEALQSGTYEASQVQVTYQSGLQVWANGHRTEPWTVTCGEVPYVLPPGSFLAQGPGGLLVYSADPGQGRIDYAHTATHVYCDARGTQRKIGALTLDGAAVIAHQKWNIDLLPLECRGPVTVDLTKFWSDRRLPPLRLLAFRSDEDEPVNIKATTSGSDLTFVPEEEYCRYRITLPEWMVEPGR
ncbi:MAG: hypothetical protein WDA75_08205 [Candidatus Latescibacterota bacterium]